MSKYALYNIMRVYSIIKTMNHLKVWDNGCVSLSCCTIVSFKYNHISYYTYFCQVTSTWLHILADICIYMYIVLNLQVNCMWMQLLCKRCCSLFMYNPWVMLYGYLLYDDIIQACVISTRIHLTIDTFNFEILPNWCNKHFIILYLFAHLFETMSSLKIW